MFFLLQNKEENKDMNLEFEIISELLNNSRVHSYTTCSIDNITKRNELLGAIPIGSIQFVTKFLNKIYDIEQINPIEIPKCLKTPEFLKREYDIVPYDYIPETGNWFIKDASTLKSFIHFGNKENMPENSKEHLYQISEILNVQSEYRVYIIDGKVENICNYNGEPLILPDTNLIKKANAIYSIQPDYPKSYTIDVMVSDRGTSIIEIHPFISVGLYSTLWGANLLQAYIDGINYVRKHNTKLIID
jgi:hypothetical protein